MNIIYIYIYIYIYKKLCLWQCGTLKVQLTFFIMNFDRGEYSFLQSFRDRFIFTFFNVFFFIEIENYIVIIMLHLRKNRCIMCMCVKNKVNKILYIIMKSLLDIYVLII